MSKPKPDIMTLLRASDHVIKYARYSNAPHARREPYIVRWPLSAGKLIRARDTDLLVDKVAAEMVKRKLT